MSTSRRLALGALAAVTLATLGCGPKARTVPGGDQEPAAKAVVRPAIEAQQPLLRWIPKDAELVLIAKSLDELERLGSVVAPLTEAADFSQAEFFASPWLRQGIDGQGTMALFTQGRTVTVLAPLAADTSTLNAAWTPLGDGGPAAARWGVPSDSQPQAWLDVLRQAARGQSYSSLPTAAWSFTPEEGKALLGHLPVVSLLATAAGGEEYLSCLPLLRAARGMRLAARALPEGGAQARFEMQLSPEAAAGIASVLGPGPGPGIIGLRGTEAVHASLALELPLAAAALREQGCPELAQVLDEVTQNMPWSPAPRALHAVGTRIDTSDLSGSVALRVDQHNRRFVAKQLDKIPGRSFFESRVTVGGQKVTRLSVPTMSSVYYQLTDSRLLFATKKSMMATLLVDGAAGEASTREVFAVGLWPSRLRQLKELLLQVAPSRDVAELWTDLLRRFEYAGLGLELVDQRLVLEMTIRPGT